MTSLMRTVGRPLGAVFLLLTALWAVGLIVLPQVVMMERSLWLEERDTSGEQKINALYTSLDLKRFDLEDAKAEDTKKQIADEITALEREVAALEAQENAPRKVYTTANYTRMSGLHFTIFVKTIAYALAVTLLALAVCYPVAYAVAHLAPPARAGLLLVGLAIPYAINELLRVYAWLMILDTQGVLNSLLAWLGVVDFQARTWIPFLESSGAVFVAMVYTYTLFMVFPIYNTLETLDRNQIEAARDLGASTVRIHRRVVIPHAKPGIAVGCLMTFMLAVGSYSVPQVMTRGKAGDWFSQLIYRQFFESFNWNVGAAYSFTLLLTCIAFILIMMKLFKVGIRDIAK
ncbi:ABC transporter permease [Pararhodospirillum photometricum]|uniref:Binding-protein-dependent transport systems inner membrane component n=1 Tax=Pararhodospirillum photometricum DSM 122 TaxID=1150469 RepID=H6SPE1_PARPM|nr:ABC transporter permease [Pararhodospirillum photometricum]CCG09466.1 Binding-protein-dependent transport systems inner membrane component [Pararhodospirillum photometricum DSM 122]